MLSRLLCSVTVRVRITKAQGRETILQGLLLLLRWLSDGELGRLRDFVGCVLFLFPHAIAVVVVLVVFVTFPVAVATGPVSRSGIALAFLILWRVLLRRSLLSFRGLYFLHARLGPTKNGAVGGGGSVRGHNGFCAWGKLETGARGSCRRGRGEVTTGRSKETRMIKRVDGCVSV
jgi:hypothetical protein